MTTTSIILITIGAAVVMAMLAVIAVFWAVGKAADQLEPYQDIYHEVEPPDEKEQIEADIKAFHKGLENGDIIPIIGFKAYKTEDEPNNKEI